MSELDLLPIPLLAWYNEEKRDLPWRETADPYPVWVSEIMLQQTRVAAVLGYYRRFLDAFPTLPDLAAAPEDFLLKMWEGLGYYSRARNLQKAARRIMTDYGGAFPRDYETIRSLPGVGDYTAAAVSSISFGLPRAAVDGNVLRVASRITGLRDSVDLPATRRAVTAALDAVIPLSVPGMFNQAMMELGATVCLPKGAPACQGCPASSFCFAHIHGKTGELPRRSPKRPRRAEERRVYLLFHGDRVALRKRPSRGLLAGLWELPNTLEGESIPLPDPLHLTPAGAGKHVFTHIEWHMTAWAGEWPEAPLPEGWVWAGREELREVYSVPSAFSWCFDGIYRHFREKGEDHNG